MKKYINKRPWAPSFHNAKRRCAPGGKYEKYGIKFLMTLENFEGLWFKHKAYNMKKPSIDRIDNFGNYTLENCQFIEYSINSGKRDRKRRDIGVRREPYIKHNIKYWKSGIKISDSQKTAMSKGTILYNHNRWHKNKKCSCVLAPPPI